MADEWKQELEVCSVWPLFGFDPHWRHARYDFPHDVHLWRLSSGQVQALLRALRGSWCSNWQDVLDADDQSDPDARACPIWWESPLRWAETDLEWALSVEAPKIPERQGESLNLRVEWERQAAAAFFDSFSLLRLDVIAPLHLMAPMGSHGPRFDEATIHSDPWDMRVADPDRLPFSALEEKDVRCLKTAWKGLAKLRGLVPRKNHVKRAKELLSRLKEEVDILARTPDLAGKADSISRLTGSPISLENAAKFAEACGYGPGSDEGQTTESSNDRKRDEARRLLERRFRETEEDRLHNATRLGRAVSIFTSSTHLPLMQKFLSMCFLLEVLFNTGQDGQRGATKRMIAGRVSLLLGDGEEDRSRLRGTAEKVYRARSKIVHGGKEYGQTDPRRISLFVRWSAFDLARNSILAILESKPLFKLFSDPAPGDAAGIDCYFKRLERS